jgi:hypothetical protein
VLVVVVVVVSVSTVVSPVFESLQAMNVAVSAASTNIFFIILILVNNFNFVLILFNQVLKNPCH